MLRDHFQGNTDPEDPPLSSFIEIKKYEGGYYCVSVLTEPTITAAMSALSSGGKKAAAALPASALASIDVWIPESILQHVLSGMVERFESTGSKPKTRKMKPKELKSEAGLPHVRFLFALLLEISFIPLQILCRLPVAARVPASAKLTTRPVASGSRAAVVPTSRPITYVELSDDSGEEDSADPVIANASWASSSEPVFISYSENGVIDLTMDDD